MERRKELELLARELTGAAPQFKVIDALAFNLPIEVREVTVKQFYTPDGDYIGNDWDDRLEDILDIVLDDCNDIDLEDFIADLDDWEQVCCTDCKFCMRTRDGVLHCSQKDCYFEEPEEEKSELLRFRFKEK